MENQQPRRPCESCGGKGKLIYKSQVDPSKKVEATCPACSGTGRQSLICK